MPTPFPSASRLGFGCASLGSRVGRREGLQALAAAHDRGINWLDLAPSYGDGEAEPIVAEFMHGRRGTLHIASKCGIAPPEVGALARIAKPVARAVVQAVPNLRGVVARGRAGAATLPLSGTLIRDSVERSLRRLRTDHLDVIALHDPNPADVIREDVAGALSDVLKAGKARVAGVAGSIEAALAALRAGLPIGHVQIADGPGQAGLDRLRKEAGGKLANVHVVTHSLYSRPMLTAALTATGERQRRIREQLDAAGYGGLDYGSAIHAAALDYALRSNPSGTVLLSMFKRAHIDANVARLLAGPGHDAVGLLAGIWQGDAALRRGAA